MNEDKKKDFLETLHSQVKEVGINNIYSAINEQNKLNIKEKTFYNKLSLSHDSHNLTLVEFMMIMEALEADNNGRHIYVFEDMLELFGLKCDRYYADSDTDISYKSLLTAWMDWDRDHGQVAQVIGEALEDNKISQNEISTIKKEINESIESLIKLRAILIKASQSKTIVK